MRKKTKFVVKTERQKNGGYTVKSIKFYTGDSCWNDAIDKNSKGEIIDISVENGYAAEKVDRYRSRYLLIDTQTLLKNHTL